MERVIFGQRLTRRQVLRAAAVGPGGLSAAMAMSFPDRVAADPSPCRDDVAIDAATALLFSAEAPLVPAKGMRDARAVWCHIPAQPDKSVLILLHGYNGFVTVDASGRSRVPDWAAGNDAARAGALAKQAAPLIYGLDRLEARQATRRPVVLVPEVSTLATGSFWAKDPAGQYADPARLEKLVSDCWKHLACLHKPSGRPYLTGGITKQVLPAKPARADGPALERVYLCGHSGAGLPLEEAANALLIQPESGVPADLWLLDCTYWSQVAGFVRFCEHWKRSGHLAAGQRDAARFVCIYRPKTQTEEVADTLRREIAKIIGLDSNSLVRDHSPLNLDTEIRPALKDSAVLFLRTYVPHDEIPTFFVPVLLESAAN